MNVLPRLKRLLAQDGRCFDVAIDHGFFNERSFLTHIEDMPRVVATIVGAGPDAEAAVAAAERAFGITYQWTPAARVCAARLDFPARASNIARGTPALLVIRGADDEAVPATGIDRLHAALRPNYIHAPDRLRFETLTGIGHGLDELGKVAALADDWLSEHLTDW